MRAIAEAVVVLIPSNEFKTRTHASFVFLYDTTFELYVFDSESLGRFEDNQRIRDTVSSMPEE